MDIVGVGVRRSSERKPDQRRADGHTLNRWKRAESCPFSGPRGRYGLPYGTRGQLTARVLWRRRTSKMLGFPFIFLLLVRAAPTFVRLRVAAVPVLLCIPTTATTTTATTTTMDARLCCVVRQSARACKGNQGSSVRHVAGDPPSRLHVRRGASLVPRACYVQRAASSKHRQGQRWRVKGQDGSGHGIGIIWARERGRGERE